MVRKEEPKVETQAGYKLGQLWNVLTVDQRKYMLEGSMPDSITELKWELIPIPNKNAICMLVVNGMAFI